MEQYLWLGLLGFIVGALGTLIGAGGGFVLVPLLLLIYPQESPQTITSITLAVVFFNALSGTAAYARMKRVDYKSGLIFSSATIPGAILGAVTTAFIPRRLFDLAFGVLILAVSAYLLFRPWESESPGKDSKSGVKSPYWQFTRSFADAAGYKHTFTYNPILGISLSVFVGYLSTLLGIGGGIIHVPALVRLLNFPVHVATATSHFILAIMALTGTITHILTGAFGHGVRRTAALAIGVTLGAPLGAMLSTRVRENWIISGLAMGLAAVGIRILIMAF
jgi:uncharacterized membrane protein YfcA